MSLVSQKGLWLSQSQGQDSGIRSRYNLHVWRNPKESTHKLLSIDLKMTAPFPAFPWWPLSDSKHTKLGGGLEKLFLLPPAMPCIPSHTVLRETHCCSQHFLHSWMGYRAVGRTDTVSTSIYIHLPNMEFNLKLVLRFTGYVYPIQPSQASTDSTKPRQFHLKF